MCWVIKVVRVFIRLYADNLVRGPRGISEISAPIGMSSIMIISFSSIFKAHSIACSRFKVQGHATLF